VPPARATRWRNAIDLNAVASGLLRDLASIQSSEFKQRGYNGAAAAIIRLDEPLTALRQHDGTWRKLAGVGPSSERILQEVLDSGGSPTVESAVAASGKTADVARRRALREQMLSRARVIEILQDSSLPGPSLEHYHGDFQMHSEWSDGALPLPELAAACIARGYRFSAVTDHSHGLPFAAGMSIEAMRRQHDEIDRVNEQTGDAFRLLKGVEANILADGSLDLGPDDLAGLEIVLAAPHAKLRGAEDQTARILRTVETPGVHTLAHPRGRKLGERAGIVADWPRIFAAAKPNRVAIELDGDPSRQDLDAPMAAQALAAGCVFALDSDAHSAAELVYSETAVAHARLAGIPADRIINCWTLEQLLDWMAR
jgi:histidinol phosphatase-like PHP family hydrolase